MAQAEGVGSAIVDAVVNAAMAERHIVVQAQMESDLAARKARDEKERSDQARERWEQCIDWLDKNVPNWEILLPQPTVSRIRASFVPVEVV